MPGVHITEEKCLHFQQKPTGSALLQIMDKHDTLFWSESYFYVAND